MSSWYTENNGFEVISTRIRLARNLRGLPFPSRMTALQRKELKNKVKTALYESNTPYSKSLKYIDMENVPENEIAAMVERHIISKEFTKNYNDKAIIISDDESISIMIGEEDHLRIQVILGGLKLQEAYRKASEIDTFLSSKLSFAFDEELGFLTECPTNLGTGLRASVMLHLPVLESKGEIRKLSDAVNKIGFTIRGMYGEGSKPIASMYQISNQITLGISEKNAIDNLGIITSQLIDKEKNAKEHLDKLKIEDLSYRALGILKYCRIIESEEMMNLLSTIKLGQSLGIIKDDINTLKLLIEGQPHMLMKKYGEMKPNERDIQRAEFLRKEINNEI